MWSLVTLQDSNYYAEQDFDSLCLLLFVCTCLYLLFVCLYLLVATFVFNAVSLNHKIN